MPVSKRGRPPKHSDDPEGQQQRKQHRADKERARQQQHKLTKIQEIQSSTILLVIGGRPLLPFKLCGPAAPQVDGQPVTPSANEFFQDCWAFHEEKPEHRFDWLDLIDFHSMDDDEGNAGSDFFRQVHKNADVDGLKVDMSSQDVKQAMAALLNDDSTGIRDLLTPIDGLPSQHSVSHINYLIGAQLASKLGGDAGPGDAEGDVEPPKPTILFTRQNSIVKAMHEQPDKLRQLLKDNIDVFVDGHDTNLCVADCLKTETDSHLRDKVSFPAAYLDTYLNFLASVSSHGNVKMCPNLSSQWFYTDKVRFFSPALATHWGPTCVSVCQLEVTDHGQATLQRL